ncbi:MAG: prolyl oligopeptidase [Alphaproteobacteria bacterium]|jgi:prolyl oligopeptidase
MHDPYLYLEAPSKDLPTKKQKLRANAWGNKQTAKAVSHLKATSSYASLHADACTILGDKDKAIFATIRDDNFAYNFKTDENNPLGRLRRKALRDYENNRGVWDILLDVGAVAKSEGTNWSYAGSTLSPNKKRLIIKLSPDGGDATVLREFDIETKSFVKDGLNIGLGKVNFCYIDDDTLLVSSTCENDLTKSSYARRARLVKRGRAYQNSESIIRIEEDEMAVYPFRCHDTNFSHTFIEVALTFWTYELYYVGEGNALTKLKLPAKLSISAIDKTHIYLHLQEDWKVDIKANLYDEGVVESSVTYKTGDIVTVHLAQALKGKLDVQLVYRADSNSVIEDFSYLNGRTAVISQMKDVCGELLVLKKSAATWHVDHKIALPENGSVSVGAYIEKQHKLIVYYTNHLTPSTEYIYHLKNRSLKAIKSQKSHFDNENMQVTQQFSTSKDGTKIPYFIMHKKGLQLNGKNPTILYGYGGFSVNLEPGFSNLVGKLWLERGGVYVIANIRGGAEYGPTWHTSVLEQNRHKCYEDFESVAEKLIADKVTSTPNLGISGGSNGGLLVGACVTRRPELYGAVNCAVPLLDMIRLEHIGAGASWVGEYGKPSDSPEMESYLLGYSPYHNVKENVKYPRIYFSASQADDRTHPAHARKMVVLMTEQGHDVLYNETTEGGHTGGTDINKQAEEYALKYSYFFSELT